MKSEKKDTKLSVRAFLAAFAAGLAVLAAVSWYVISLFAQQIEFQRQEERRLLLNVYDGMESELSERYYTMSEELKFLGSSPDLLSYIAQPSAQRLNDLEYNWRRFLQRSGLFSHVRLVGADGAERLHLKYDEESRTASVVPNTRPKAVTLCRQIERTSELEPKQIYIFKIQPYSFEDDFSPVIRLGMPLFSPDGQRFGVMMLTYRARAIIDSFRRIDRSTGSALAVLNGDGLWLYNQGEPEKTWRNQDEKGLVLAQDISAQQWLQVKSLRFGEYYDESGLHYHFRSFLPLPYVDYSGNQDSCIIFMSTYSPQQYGYFAPTPRESSMLFCWQEYWYVLVFLLGLNFVQAFVSARYWRRRARFKRLQNQYLLCEMTGQLAMKAGCPPQYSPDGRAACFRELVSLIASNMAQPLEHREMVVEFAPLCFLGKLALPPGLCARSPADMTPDEKKLYRRHADFGCAMIDNSDLAEPERTIARRMTAESCEDWDGRGYPQGLSGSNISPEGRLCRIARFYDALRLMGMTHSEARRRIMSEGGRALDPQMVNAFMASDPLIQKLYGESEQEKALEEKTSES
ncbi:MAG: HD domain-containing phosphohydrolase [Pyramidobacter sp.]|nr:HD domain-containing phosphohydrolase [Pyramidobacter sp.]